MQFLFAFLLIIFQTIIIEWILINKKATPINHDTFISLCLILFFSSFIALEYNYKVLTFYISITLIFMLLDNRLSFFIGINNTKSNITINICYLLLLFIFELLLNLITKIKFNSFHITFKKLITIVLFNAGIIFFLYTLYFSNITFSLIYCGIISSFFLVNFLLIWVINFYITSKIKFEEEDVFYNKNIIYSDSLYNILTIQNSVQKIKGFCFYIKMNKRFIWENIDKQNLLPFNDIQDNIDNKSILFTISEKVFGIYIQMIDDKNKQNQLKNISKVIKKINVNNKNKYELFGIEVGNNSESIDSAFNKMNKYLNYPGIFENINNNIYLLNELNAIYLQSLINISNKVPYVLHNVSTDKFLNIIDFSSKKVIGNINENNLNLTYENNKTTNDLITINSQISSFLYNIKNKKNVDENNIISFQSVKFDLIQIKILHNTFKYYYGENYNNIVYAISIEQLINSTDVVKREINNFIKSNNLLLYINGLNLYSNFTKEIVLYNIFKPDYVSFSSKMNSFMIYSGKSKEFITLISKKFEKSKCILFSNNLYIKNLDKIKKLNFLILVDNIIK